MKEIKHKPILFSTPMVQAILEGRKTQTRRILGSGFSFGHPLFIEGTKARGAKCHLSLDKCTTADWEEIKSWCPFGQPGQILWVRETVGRHSIGGCYVYKADTKEDPDEIIKWRPSIHMPKAACRIWLLITNIRMQRLQDISEQDSKAEGIEPLNIYSFPIYRNYLPGAPSDGYQSAQYSFRSLWQKINGAESWKANPFVWVIEFERVEKPEIK